MNRIIRQKLSGTAPRITDPKVEPPTPVTRAIGSKVYQENYRALLRESAERSFIRSLPNKLHSARSD